MEQENIKILSKLSDSNDELLKNKQKIIDELHNEIYITKKSESENINIALQQNNKIHELEKQNLLGKICFLEKEQSFKNLIEESDLDIALNDLEEKPLLIDILFTVNVVEVPSWTLFTIKLFMI